MRCHAVVSVFSTESSCLIVEAPLLTERQVILSEADAYIKKLQSDNNGKGACKKSPVAAFVTEKLEPALKAVSSDVSKTWQAEYSGVCKIAMECRKDYMYLALQRLERNLEDLAVERSAAEEVTAAQRTASVCMQVVELAEKVRKLKRSSTRVNHSTATFEIGHCAGGRIWAAGEPSPERYPCHRCCKRQSSS